MWNENAPLELLKELPAKLSEENLSEIQKVIDADKYENSVAHGRDLCGEYAPFCETCDKGAGYPCATAYVRMKQAEGMEVALVRDEEQPEEYSEPEYEENTEPEYEENTEPEYTEHDYIQEQFLGGEYSEPEYEQPQEYVEEQQPEEKPVRRIRIAVAKRRR